MLEKPITAAARVDKDHDAQRHTAQGIDRGIAPCTAWLRARLSGRNGGRRRLRHLGSGGDHSRLFGKQCEREIGCFALIFAGGGGRRRRGYRVVSKEDKEPAHKRKSCAGSRVKECAKAVGRGRRGGSARADSGREPARDAEPRKSSADCAVRDSQGDEGQRRPEDREERVRVAGRVQQKRNADAAVAGCGGPHDHRIARVLVGCERQYGRFELGHSCPCPEAKTARAVERDYARALERGDCGEVGQHAVWSAFFRDARRSDWDLRESVDYTK